MIASAKHYEQFAKWAEINRPTLDIKWSDPNYPDAGFYRTETQRAFGIWWAGYKMAMTFLSKNTRKH